MKRLYLYLIILLLPIRALASPSVDPALDNAVRQAPLGLHPVVITYRDQPGGADLFELKLQGITGGFVLRELPMVLTRIDGRQLGWLRTHPDVVSLYANHIHQPYTNASREFIGQAALMRDREVTTANGGLPVSGKGIGVAVVDTGLDATHSDLSLGNNVVQNVYFPLADVPLNFPAGLVPPVAFEDQPMTDIEGGHGTFVSGVVGATGAASGNFYGGVAPGADLIGLVAGNDAGLSTFAIVTAYDWILVNQFRYNIRVVNNSFGSDLGSPDNYDPFDPINVGTRKMHDRFIAVVYAAGNSGDAPGAINRLAVAPWVISVAAGEKEGLGTPASFSSRGEDNGSGIDSAGHPADPLQPPNLRPDITAPGVNIKSTRSKGPGVTNLAGTALLQDNDIPPGFLPFYTTSQGTSFASPHVAGVAALMLEADPMLTPQDIMEILRETAMPMPFAERVVGAGFVDAHNAVRRVLELSAVEAPANLIPGPDTPEIVDSRNDQIGTRAQDILHGRFRFDEATDRLLFELEMADMTERTPNARWTQSALFGDVRVFVSSNVTETGEFEFTHGTIAPDPDTGVNTQTNLGLADAGRLDGNRLIVELALQRISNAAGFDVFGSTARSTQANAQILIGSSLTGGLLLNADSASGRDFTVGPDNGNPPDDGGDGDGDGNGDGTENDDPSASDCSPGIHERFADVLHPGETRDIGFGLVCPDVSAQATYHPGIEQLDIELHSADSGRISGPTGGNDRRIAAEDLPAGDYFIRVSAPVDRPVDYVVQVRQNR
ncbi:MAG: S8 family serine peptidase [Wenzhouxiangella sp.]